ncbi:golgi-associated PDZ and coiled-coil motif-containing protein-like isoform X2 [Dinothrombium tinctorium]|uniref:Golgi-associated PDZ and coiled-coil motif-containing protein-like isoform X2 n=1 Tax=Dinothrombium tinctorium TaxID=1965070 RepID=A0A443RAF8_9ACAR|nr:golgi-associated PDZ and coiled-coil motif-containing protein-like isoform X2 [Dinothrombium tinctorium]
MSEKQRTLAAKAGVLWLDLLEKEFDKAYVDLDVLLNQMDDDQSDVVIESRLMMSALSSTFAQLAHKCLVLADNNSLLDQTLSEMRQELIAVKSDKSILERELDEKNRQLDAIANTYNTKRNQNDLFRRATDDMKTKLRQLNHMNQEIVQLRKENITLRRRLLNAESELFGARLAAKYLDKELSGRIQQIQLLGKPNVKGEDQDRVWNQLEAEIHLHRHKTVVKACRGKSLSLGQKCESPEKYEKYAKTRQGVGNIREVVIERNDDEGLGISITGGKEHGIPILVSEIHRNTPASRCGSLYVGDAILSVNGIDLRSLKHSEAAEILTNQKSKCVFQVVFVSPEDDDDESESEMNSASVQKYAFLDPNIVPEDEQQDEHDAINTDDTIDDCDNISSITDTMNPSPNKYPGVAKLCSSIGPSSSIQNENNSKKSKETLIE